MNPVRRPALVIAACFALALPLAAATEPMVEQAEPLDFSKHASGIDWSVTWNITDEHVHVGLPGLTMPADRSHGPVAVLIAIGFEGDAIPTEWYVLHHGNTTFAVDHDGRTDDDPRSGLGTPYWQIDRINGTKGDCVVVAAETWQRVDDQRQVLARVPGTPLDEAWGDGHNCHVQDGEQASAPAPEKATPMAPWLAAIGLLAAIAIRRR